MPPQPETPAPRPSAAPWIAFGVGALFLIGAFAVVGLLALQADNDRVDTSGRITSPENASPGAAPPFEQGNPHNPRGDHWHVAFGFYVCDEYLPIMEDPGLDPDGIHTHSDGAIHVHPFHRGAAGENATMAVFERAAGIRLDDDGFEVPGADVRAGDDCGGTPGEIGFFVNGDDFPGDPSDYRFADGDVVVMALVAPGEGVPPLPWAEVLLNLSDLPPPI